MTPVFLDITELAEHPVRSGIQRAERALIRHWPGPAALLPCRFDPAADAMRELPQGVFEVLCADAPPGGADEERCRLAPLMAEPGPRVPAGARLLCAELFNETRRAAFYAGPAGSSAAWLVYDFLPWLHPRWFGTRVAVSFMPYLQAMRGVADLAFISAQTRTECAARILRRPASGPVVPMGADGLGLARQDFNPARTDFVMLGSIEPRKNAAQVMRAFRKLWAQGCEARLVMIGAPVPDAAEEQALLRELAGDRRFRHLPGLSDAGVREVLASARAMLFPSEGEGYGIPPTEGLYCGIPVVVWAGLPALAGLKALGQIRLAQVNPTTIAAAVRTLLDEAEARRLWAEAARLVLPSWRHFAQDVAGWVLRPPRG